MKSEKFATAAVRQSLTCQCGSKFFTFHFYLLPFFTFSFAMS